MGDAAAASGSLFEQATRVFDGLADRLTGLRVLRVRHDPTSPHWPRWRMMYHQQPTFHDGGRKLIVQYGSEPHVVDLTTGEWTQPPPRGYGYMCVHPRTGVASVAAAAAKRAPGREAVLFDMLAQRELARFGLPEWYFSEATMLADGRRAVAQFWQGEPYDEPARSRFFLMDTAGGITQFLEAENHFCNHVQGCPSDPDLIAYDRWPSPKRPTEQVIHLMRLDGSFHQMLPLQGQTVRPGPVWGWQRDHYLWTADGRWIVSYFNTSPAEHADHFAPGWWVSATDWGTGEDISAPYPPGRWGCNFNVTPDSRFIVSGGGPDFQRIYAIEIEALRKGWNERVLCSYPPTQHDRAAGGPYHMPWVLPDQSGVIFAAGWYGPQDGIYMVEWPSDWR